MGDRGTFWMPVYASRAVTPSLEGPAVIGGDALRLVFIVDITSINNQRPLSSVGLPAGDSFGLAWAWAPRRWAICRA